MQLLRTALNDVVNTLIANNVEKNELDGLIELTSDYGLNLGDVLQDTFEGKIAREIKKIIAKIDDLFKEYDDWQTNE